MDRVRKKIRELDRHYHPSYGLLYFEFYRNNTTKNMKKFAQRDFEKFVLLLLFLDSLDCCACFTLSEMERDGE